MKHKIFIFNVIAVLFFCLTAYSQTSENETKIGKKEQKKIEKFIDEFIKDLRRKNDLGQGSEEFFVSDFKTRLAKNSSLRFLSGKEELGESISDSEQYGNKIALNNFFNLMMMLVEENKKPSAEDGDEDSDFPEVIASLPPQILELIKRDELLRLMVEDNEDENSAAPMTIDIRDFVANINIVSDAVRLELKNKKSKSSEKSEKTEIYSEICEGEKCLGLPEGTEIFAIHKYSMCLRIIRVNNELKIADIFSVIDED